MPSDNPEAIPQPPIPQSPPEAAIPGLTDGFRHFAARAQAATRSDTPIIVREAMLVLGRWRRPANPESWNVQEREAARLLGRNDCAGAAIALLPVGALLRIESLNPLHDWAEVTLPNGGPSAEATAQSSAAAIIAALFRALAEKYEVPPGKATTP